MRSLTVLRLVAADWTHRAGRGLICASFMVGFGFSWRTAQAHFQSMVDRARAHRQAEGER